MPLKVDYTQLTQLILDFYAITKIPIVLFDENKNCIFTHPEKMCDFCSEIRKSKEMTKLCISHDNMGFAACAESKQLYIYKCHMGLVEVVAPIIDNEVIIGYMLFGQIIDNKDRKELISIVCAKADKYALDKEVLLKKLRSVKYLSKNKLLSFAKILLLCARYSLLSGIVQTSFDNYSVSISKYIEQNLSNSLSVPKICNHFFISKSFLYSISNKYYEMSITRYIKAKRMEKAKELLMLNEYSISDIAYLVGFSDANYFAKVFKKYVGVSPRDYKSVVPVQLHAEQLNR